MAAPWGKPFSPFAVFEPATSRVPDIGPVNVREARAGDVDGMAAVAAWRRGVDQRATAVRMRQVLQEARSLSLVAERGGSVVGYARTAWWPPVPDPSGAVPEGWYLLGVTVAPEVRRAGIATALTEARVRWLDQRCELSYYFANGRNQASIALHRTFGYREIGRGMELSGVVFAGGVGVLFRRDREGS